MVAMATPTQHKNDRFRQAITAPIVESDSWTVEESFRYCERIARSHYENFPVGSVLVPRHLRKHFYSIYAFARTADDFADEGYDGTGPGEQARLDLLAEWREMLRDSLAGRAAHPIFIALRETQKQFDLPAALFEDLISAFTQDVTVRRYQTFDELLDYCRRSANPVGRLILYLFGHSSEQMLRWSDAICTALQLANHWQDVAIDLQKDRIYLPAEDLRAFNVSEAEIKRGEVGNGFRQLMAHEVARAKEMLMSGKPLCVSVRGRLGLELRAVWLGGWRILESIEASGYDVFKRRSVISATDKLRIMFSAITREGFKRN